MTQSKVTIEVPKNMIAAISRFAAKEDIRYYLNGLCFEWEATGEARMIATNGHMLAVARIEKGVFADGDGSAIVPLDAFKGIKAKLKRGELAAVSLDLALNADGTGTWSLYAGEESARMSGKTIEGRFPAWRQVIPSQVSGEVAHFNPEYLLAAHKAAQDMGNMFLRGLGYNGTGAAYLDIAENVFGVLMPMMASHCEELPEWVTKAKTDTGGKIVSIGVKKAA